MAKRAEMKELSLKLSLLQDGFSYEMLSVYKAPTFILCSTAAEPLFIYHATLQDLKEEFNDWTLMFCQLHRVTSGQSNTVIGQHTFSHTHTHRHTHTHTHTRTHTQIHTLSNPFQK